MADCVRKVNVIFNFITIGNSNRMKEKQICYISPYFETIEMEPEGAVLAASDSNVENPVEGEESDW